MATIINVFVILLLSVILLFVVRMLWNIKLGEMFMDIHSPGSSKTSWTRAASTSLVLLASCITMFQVYKGMEVQTELILMLCGIAFSGKVTQKIIETKK